MYPAIFRYMDQSTLAMLLGGLNVIQLLTYILTIRSQLKKERAGAKIEEANSVEKSQAIYDKLTERLNKELETLYGKLDKNETTMEKQNITIATLNLTVGQQKTEIEMLHKLVKGYQEKCINCSNNSTKR